MIYAFIEKHRSVHRVERMVGVLGVTKSGYYAWRRKGQSRRSLQDRALIEEIRESYNANKGRCGSPRIHEDLKALGYRCGRKRVARLMIQEGLRARTKRRFRATTQSGHRLPVAENLLKREFRVEMPDRVWASDITYLWTHEGWLYLAVVMDLCSRKVVGWSTDRHLGAELALDALRKAVELRRPPAGLMFHSDRGVQYASEVFRAELKRNGMVQSMSRKGDCWDNAVVESFFGTLKRELVYHESYGTRADARLSVFQYIEGYYNRRRRHSALGYLSPIGFEQAAMAA